MNKRLFNSILQIGPHFETVIIKVKKGQSGRLVLVCIVVLQMKIGKKGLSVESCLIIFPYSEIPTLNEKTFYYKVTTTSDYEIKFFLQQIVE